MRNRCIALPKMIQGSVQTSSDIVSLNAMVSLVTFEPAFGKFLEKTGHALHPDGIDSDESRIVSAELKGS